MSKQYICCTKCYHHLSDINPELGRFWVLYCSFCFTHDSPFFAYNDFVKEDEMYQKALEKEGFVVSHENDVEILYFLKGWTKGEKTDFFCCLCHEDCLKSKC